MRQKQYAFYPFSFKNIALLAGVWLLTGFIIGTLTLMGPVRWTAIIVRENHLGSTVENRIVMILIGLLVIGTFFLSVFLSKVMINAFVKFPRVAIPVILGVFAGISLIYWLTPAAANVNKIPEAQIITKYGEFTFGSFPLEGDLRRLKQQGYTAVIPLLHPAVIPFEPKLLAQEYKNAQEAGLEIISIPMLPWVSENKVSLDKLADIAQNGKGKYYVHCYLGKDRVNVARTLIEKYAVTIKMKRHAARNIADLKKFERGEILNFGDSVFVTPLPTDEEYFGYLLNGRIKKIVSILENTPELQPFIQKEAAMNAAYKMDYSFIATPSIVSDKKTISDLMFLIKESPKPIVIHSFNMTSDKIKLLIQELQKQGTHN